MEKGQEHTITAEEFDKKAQALFEKQEHPMSKSFACKFLTDIRDELWPEEVPEERKMLRRIVKRVNKIMTVSDKPELKDTVDGMLSDDYRERFVAEFLQAKIRYKKLKKFCNKIEAAQMKGTEEPKHDCPLELLREQQKHMGQYLYTLEVRAEIEGIDLP